MGVNRNLKTWVTTHYVNLAVFNMFVVLLVLLNSANYFDPFWKISINLIVLLSLVASIFLLGAGSRTMFLISLIFWLFAGLMALLDINVWAERIAIYVFEAFTLGFLLLLIEFFLDYTKVKERLKKWRNLEF